LDTITSSPAKNYNLKSAIDSFGAEKRGMGGNI